MVTQAVTPPDLLCIGRDALRTVLRFGLWVLAAALLLATFAFVLAGAKSGLLSIALAPGLLGLVSVVFAR